MNSLKKPSVVALINTNLHSFWFLAQLIQMSTTKYFSEGSLIADSRELADGLMVIISGQVGVELPMDSAEADEENKKPDGTTLLYVFGRG